MISIDNCWFISFYVKCLNVILKLLWKNIGFNKLFSQSICHFFIIIICVMFYFFLFQDKNYPFCPNKCHQLYLREYRNTHLKNNEWVFHKCAFILVTVYFFVLFLPLVIMFLVLTLILSNIPASHAVLGSFLLVFANIQITVAICKNNMWNSSQHFVTCAQVKEHKIAQNIFYSSQSQYWFK